ncbi:hypothetical protein PLESTF_000834200 [Pleodorina starrii]|nr:hypothetical protein PLESTM_000901000 [Pleodorina starrii]GLC69469.1 hypothetical protein PLESTF_000834200 [Pleodorina starrii]
MLSCFITPASLQPRKVYNTLVPQVFPTLSPDPRQNVPKAVERKMEKLAEYLQKYPARTAKVSRRLTRRLKKDLRNRVYGQVKVAVYTYKYLLSKSSEEGSNFTFSYFAKELIDEPDVVLKTLLGHTDPMVRRFGAELLASYIKAQSPVEHQLKLVEPLVTTVCELAGQAGGDEQLKMASLNAIAEYVGLCHELKMLPTKLEEIMGAVLKNLDTSKGASATGEPSAAPDETTLHGLAHSVLLKFKPFLQDISTVYRVMETLFKHLDQGSGWQKAEAVQNLMAIVQSSCSEQPFPLFAALIRHSSGAGLRSDERAVVINLALQQAPVYSLSAFSMALQELPRALTADQYSDTTQLRGTILAAMRQLAQAVGDAAQMCEAISAVLRNHATPSKQAQACLECALAATLVIPTFPETGRIFPGGHAPAQLLQQLAAIITVWGPAEADSRATACELLGTVMLACGPGLRDEKQALGLMDMVLQMAQNVSLGTPADVATMSRVLAACLASRQPELLLHGVRLSKVLLGEALKYAPLASAAAAVERVAAGGAAVERSGTGDEDADRLWAVALLMLVNNLLTVLAARANCNHLLSLRFNVPAGACTSLKEEGGSMVSCSPLFEGSASQAETCLRAVQSEWPVDHWYGKVLDALCKGSILQTHYMHNLQNIIFEPFTAHALPGLPATQQLALQPSIASTANGNAAGSAHGRDAAVTQLTSKLEAMARNRVVSIKRERLNLQHVMDMLADGEGDETGTVPPAEGGKASDPVGALKDNSAVAVNEIVLSDAGFVDLMAVHEASTHPPLGLGPLEMAELMQRLDAVTG